MARPLKNRIERYDVTTSPLYGIRSHTRLVEVLHWAGSTGQLRSYVRRADNYNRFIDKSKSGKERLIEAPAVRLKDFQTRLLDLLRRIELPDYLHSARMGRSYLSNSLAHCRADGCTITMDIDSFYQSVTLQRVARLFEQRFDCTKDVAETLAHLLCCDWHLATGSPASPLISFWTYREVFDAIEHRVLSRGGKFTLYIDDMTITGRGFGHTDVLWIKRLLAGAGLSVKETKTRIFLAEAAKLVTGRAFRRGQSRAPNKQHLKMKLAEVQLERSPSDTTLRARVAGLKRHLALLDDEKRDQHRAEASAIARTAKPILSGDK